MRANKLDDEETNTNICVSVKYIMDVSPGMIQNI